MRAPLSWGRFDQALMFVQMLSLFFFFFPIELLAWRVLVSFFLEMDFPFFLVWPGGLLFLGFQNLAPSCRLQVEECLLSDPVSSPLLFQVFSNSLPF